MQLSETLGGTFADITTNGVEVFKAEFAPDYSSSGVIWAVFYDDIAKVATSLNTRIPAVVTGTDGYGIIARHSGSTLWGTVITPEIISAAAGTAIAECDLNLQQATTVIPAPNFMPL
jgi:hypothetical protein